MKPETHAEVQANAQASFARLIGYTFVGALFAVAASLFYLHLNGVLTVFTAIITGVGVFVSVMLGAGLMAMGFFSSNSGFDEEASGQYALEPISPDRDQHDAAVESERSAL